MIGFIRRDMGMDETRIILRTGQPGYAPELVGLQRLRHQRLPHQERADPQLDHRHHGGAALSTSSCAPSSRTGGAWR